MGDRTLYGFLAALLVLAAITCYLGLERLQLRRLAYLDKVSGLFNRNELDRCFRSLRAYERMAVLFLDLDQFKLINDRYGHHTGDLLIREIGTRLQTFNNRFRKAYRIGGDEFLIVVQQCNAASAERIALEVLKSIKQVYRIGGLELELTASIGIAMGIAGNSEQEEWLARADAAMYQSKRLGRDISIFHESAGAHESAST